MRESQTDECVVEEEERAKGDGWKVLRAERKERTDEWTLEEITKKYTREKNG